MKVEVRFDFEGFKETLSAYVDNINGKASQAVLQGCKVIEAAAKERVPADTGLLRRSIASRVTADGNDIVGIVGTNVEYAKHVEFGHRTRLGAGKKASKARGVHFVPGRYFVKGAFDTKRQEALSRIISVLKGG